MKAKSKSPTRIPADMAEGLVITVIRAIASRRRLIRQDHTVHGGEWGWLELLLISLTTQLLGESHFVQKLDSLILYDEISILLVMDKKIVGFLAGLTVNLLD